MECGIIFAWELGLKQIIIEGDSQTVYHGLTHETLAPASIQQVIVGSRMWLTAFTSWMACFTKRDGNVATHLLAKHAKDFVDCTI